MLKNILQKLNSSSEKLKLYASLEQNKSVSAFGTNLASRILFLNSFEDSFLIVAENVKEASKLKEHFEAIGKKTETLNYKLSGYIFHTAEQSDLIQNYYSVLYKLVNKKLDVLIITPELLMQKLPTPSSFKANILTLKTGINYDLDLLVKQLISMGYKREAMAEYKGDFSLRGDILDIFPTNSELPVRIQFFDDEIENIKTYNLLTYTTISDVKKVEISPNTLIFLEKDELEKVINKIKKSAQKADLEPNYRVRLNNITENVFLNLNFNNREASLSWCLPYLDNYQASILDYFSDKSLVVFNDVKLTVAELELLYKEFNHSIKNLKNAGEVLSEHKHFYFTKEEFIANIETNTKLAYHSLDSQNNLFLPDEVFSFRLSPVVNYSKNYKMLVNDLKNYLKQKKTVILAGENNSSSVYLEKFLEREGIKSTVITNINQVLSGKINIITTKIKEGFILVEEDLVVIGGDQLFDKKQVKRLKPKNKKSVFTMPKVGEYVVHETHGIGLCTAIERLKLARYEKDYILIKYAAGDMLYLPTEQVELISSYVGGEEEPKLNRIGGAEFARQKEKVKLSVKQMAVNLVDLYAKRQKREGFKFVEDDEVQAEFERAFPYTETEDQITAINEIKRDMQSAKIMDRLICGDVGYGKTEVALRAAFKAILSGKQVAFLAPTTILAEQHYNTCVARMSEFLVNSDSLSRFKTPKQVKESLKNLKDGTTNIVCGTHRLLSKDVKFKDLGLLILDEEQRFGVADKEKIKELKKHIDVITMSATPIPRTLHMSMIGVRDISLIETPPKDRLPVQTFVTEYSNALLQDAVNREVMRGGQVLLVHNRVDTIYNIYEKIRALLPKVEIKVAHGQMPKHELEFVIKDLYDGKIQLLLATTLIENGIDLPNANTLVVLNSDKLGLSQLYQLRGRVGRSTRLGYAYFTYEKEKMLSEAAYKRLTAINEFTELGSGFKIALRDLEIRGAGNILGREQHGHMGKVGYDMYCKILEEAVREIKGEQKQKARDIKIEVELNSYIPAEYIEEDENRFRVYSSLSGIESSEQYDEVIKEISDIYGEIPDTVVNLANTAFIKNLGTGLGVKQVTITANKCFIEFYDKQTVLSEKVNKALSQFSSVAVLKFETGAIIEFDLKGYSIKKKQDSVLKFLMLSSQI
jgi:transcription-repair coupling factor (superfamily II helicase)